MLGSISVPNRTLISALLLTWLHRTQGKKLCTIIGRRVQFGTHIDGGRRKGGMKCVEGGEDEALGMVGMSIVCSEGGGREGERRGVLFVLVLGTARGGLTKLLCVCGSKWHTTTF